LRLLRLLQRLQLLIFGADILETILGVAKLVRLPNAFTVISNVLTAPLFFAGSWDWHLIWLLPISLASYGYGMVRNDILDYSRDCELRSDRPLPRELVSIGFAKRLAGALLLVMALLGAGFFLVTREVAFVLCLASLFVCMEWYNRHAKHYWYGGVVMGACRLFNILMVSSYLIVWTPDVFLRPWPLAYPVAVGLYVFGVTQFARNEEGTSRWGDLISGLLLILLSIGMLFWAVAEKSVLANGRNTVLLFVVFLALLMPVFRACLAALLNPAPSLVQRSVGVCLRSLIVLDAFAVYLLAPDQPWQSLLVLLLLVPNLAVGLRIRSS